MSKLVQNYMLQQTVGKGVFGQVFRAIHQKTKEQFAVKVIPKSSFKSNPKLQQLAINEINILSSLKNDHIVKFIQTLKTPNNFYFVYEYCDGGTLEHLIKKQGKLKQKEALGIFRQLLDAFKQLNKNNVMHRDLKPDNIFLKNNQIKLGDFGFCKMLEINMAQTMLGSPIYMAPQILREEIYTSKADIWSLGVVLFQMLFGYCPFESNSISQLIHVLKETPLNIPRQLNQISEATQNLLQRMLVKQQFKRIQWVDLFDFQIDEKGSIISNIDKGTKIQTLQKYFLLDVFKGQQSSKNQTSQQLNHDQNHSYNKKKNIIQKNQSQQIVEIVSEKQNFQKDVELHYQKIQLKKHSQSSPIIEQKSIGQKFSKKHQEWLKGIEIIQELSILGGQNEKICMIWMIRELLKVVESEAQKHPQWIDVIIQERECLQKSLTKIQGGETLQGNGKKQLLKLWKTEKIRSKSTFEKAIRFTYGKQFDEKTSIGHILIV